MLESLVVGVPVWLMSSAAAAAFWPEVSFSIGANVGLKIKK